MIAKQRKFRRGINLSSKKDEKNTTRNNIDVD